MTPTQVGVASAFLAPGIFLSNVFLLGAHHGLLRFGREIEADHRLLFSAVWLCSGASAIGSGVSAAGLMLSGVVKPIGGSYLFSIIFYVLFVMGSVLWTISEAAFIAVRVPWKMFWRNIAFASARVVIFLPFAPLGDFGLVASLSIGTWLAAMLSIDLLRRHFHSSWEVFFAVWHPALRALVSFALPNHLVNLIANVPAMLLPLIALHLLGAETNGFFYIAWALSAILRTILAAASASLLAEGARDDRLVGSHVGQSVGFLLLAVGASALPMILFPRVVLIFFGSVYVQANVVTLPLFAISVLPSTLMTVFVARERIKQRSRYILTLSILYAFLSTALPSLGALADGYLGFTVGYLVSQCLIGLSVLPSLRRSIAPGNLYLQLLKRIGLSRA